MRSGGEGRQGGEDWGGGRGWFGPRDIDGESEYERLKRARLTHLIETDSRHRTSRLAAFRFTSDGAKRECFSDSASGSFSGSVARKKESEVEEGGMEGMWHCGEEGRDVYRGKGSRGG